MYDKDMIFVMDDDNLARLTEFRFAEFTSTMAAGFRALGEAAEQLVPAMERLGAAIEATIAAMLSDLTPVGHIAYWIATHVFRQYHLEALALVGECPWAFKSDLPSEGW